MPGPGYLTAALGDLEPRVASRLEQLRRDDVVGRIWDRDPTVWGGTPETPELCDRLGWLEAPTADREFRGDAERLRARLAGRFNQVVLCGMGGSSLAPAVIVRTCGGSSEALAFTMLDSTAPAAVAGASDDVGRTVFIISSKSGSTVETLSFQEYFWNRTGDQGAQFVAISDPESGLARMAKERGFAGVFLSDPEIGGRFSALSPFGIVPAVLAGVDGRPLLDAGASAADQARAVPGPSNPAASLGAILGEAALAGRDKLTLALSPRLGAFGLWAEQLMAESTGKGGVGILPVCGLRSAASLGPDRMVVSLRFRDERFPGDVAQLLTLARNAPHPVVDLVIDGPADLGGEFFRWEFATAVAGAILGVNPFDQPNVAESKANTNAVLSGDLNAAAEIDAAAARRVVGDVGPGDYLALLAYVPPSDDHERELDAAARSLESSTGAAVTWGYGPRYLHSTGQLHKGGSETGSFVQIVAPVESDVEIPGRPYSFGELFVAQADGDYAALRNRGRPIARVSEVGDLFVKAG